MQPLATESIIDQERPLQILSTLIKKGTVPHALLFTGIDGIGKRSSAIRFAMACNCSEHLPCGVCRSCRKIISGNHPDIHLIEPLGQYIRIDQIRELCSILAMKPYEAEMRAAIISDAQNMNPEASNALLKVLEEPPHRTILILTASQTSDLLPTIVSRCRHIRFNPIRRKTIENMLIDRHNLSPDAAAVIAGIAQGSLGRAVSMAKNPSKWIKQRNWLAHVGLKAAEIPDALQLAIAEKLSKRKDMVQESLEIMKSFLRDVIICRYDPAKIINKDLSETIQAVSKQSKIESILLKIRDIQTAQQNIRSNGNLRLTLDILFLRLAGR